MSFFCGPACGGENPDARDRATVPPARSLWAIFCPEAAFPTILLYFWCKEKRIVAFFNNFQIVATYHFSIEEKNSSVKYIYLMVRKIWAGWTSGLQDFAPKNVGRWGRICHSITVSLQNRQMDISEFRLWERLSPMFTMTMTFGREKSVHRLLSPKRS